MLRSVRDVFEMRPASGAAFLAAVVLGLSLAPLSAETETSASPERTVFGAQAEMVMVDVVVADAQGNPVTGLTRDDFAVSEEKRPQEIKSFEAVSLPLPPSEPREVQPAAHVHRPNSPGDDHP